MHALVEESQDLHSEAMRTFADPLLEWSADEGAHRRGLGLAAAGAAAAGLALAAAAPAAAATSSPDIMLLQTSAAIENLAVAVYTKALTLSFVTNPVVAAFAKTTKSQHEQHAAAFNAAATNLGGAAQHGVPAAYYAVVQKALPGITGYTPLLALAIELESIAAETYTKYVSDASTPTLRGLFGSVAPVEAQHVAVLLAVQALVNGGAAALVTLPPDIAKFPAAAGKVGFPDTFEGTSLAAPTTAGVVK